MNQYENLLQYVLENGTQKTDRTGTGTTSIFGHQLRFNLNEGFPLITSKKVHIKSIIYELLWFIKGETNIMVATTVIEVGVNVPNASVMIIESAERFGLSQLHQLRGRVGRGAEQSYCILMTSYKLTSDSKTRMETMVATNDGFEIAEVDLRLRGPGDIMGTQQSGVLDLLIADLGQDGKILQLARDAAVDLLQKDPELLEAENANIKIQLSNVNPDAFNWSKIS